MTDVSTNVLNRLFGGDQARMSTWKAQTQKRARGLAEALPPVLELNANDMDSQAAASELLKLCGSVTHNGYAFYRLHNAPDDHIANVVTTLLAKLSLCHSDQGVIREAAGLSLLQDLSGTPKGRFPPYQSKAMNWHTDGYYNDPNDGVRCFTLHCVEAAEQGGELVLMDDTLLLQIMLEDDPELVSLLTHPETMMLPRNKDDEGHDRPDRYVPMIQVNTDNTISMRFTTRSENIHWRCSKTKAAAKRATELIHANSHYHVRRRLQKGEGVITRNVLHAREPFVDGSGVSKRQMLRGRFSNLPQPVAPCSATTQMENTHVARK